MGIAFLTNTLHGWRHAAVLQVRETAVYCGSHSELTWAVLPLERLAALASQEIPSVGFLQREGLRYAGRLLAVAAVLLLPWAVRMLVCRRPKAQNGPCDAKAEAEVSEVPGGKAASVDNAGSSLQSIKAEA